MEKPYHIQCIEEKCTVQTGRVGAKYFINFWKKYIDRVPRWLDQGLDPNLSNGYYTLLGMAIFLRRLEVVKKLFSLNETSDVAQKCKCLFTSEGTPGDTHRRRCTGVYFTSLSLACNDGFKSLPIIEYLLERGHDPNDDISFVRPIDYFMRQDIRSSPSLRNRNVVVLERLLDYGIDINIRLDPLNSPLSRFFRYGYIEFLDVLDNRGLLDSIESVDGKHPFRYTFDYITVPLISSKKAVYVKYGPRFKQYVPINKIVSGAWRESTPYQQFEFILDSYDWTLDIESTNLIIKYMSKNKVLTDDQITFIISQLQFDFPIDFQPVDIRSIDIRCVVNISKASFFIIDKLIDRGFDIYKMVDRIRWYNRSDSDLDNFFQIIDRYHLDLNKVYTRSGRTLALKIMNLNGRMNKDVLRRAYIRGADYSEISRSYFGVEKKISKIVPDLTLHDLSFRSMYLNKVKPGKLPRILLR